MALFQAGKDRTAGLTTPPQRRWVGFLASLGGLGCLLVGFRAPGLAQTPAPLQEVQAGPLVVKAPMQGGAETLPAPKAATGTSGCTDTITGFPPLVVPAPERSARPTKEMDAIREGLTSHDEMFEVIVGEGRILTLKNDLAVAGKPKPLVSVGDPSVVDFVLVGPRQIRLIGQRLGATDLVIGTPDNQFYTFQVQVVADMNVLRCQLRAMFPDAVLKVAQFRDHIVVEGQARDTKQATQIIEAIRAYLISLQATQTRKITGQYTAGTPAGVPGRPGAPAGAPGPELAPPPAGAPVGVPANVAPEPGQLSVSATIAEPRIINLIRVPGPQQVLLKVRVAELNRTAMRQIGADWLAVDHDTGAIVGTQIGGAAGVSGTGILTRMLVGTASGTSGSNTTLFGIFQQGGFEVFLRALRQANILRTLAEPNLVTMNGQQANFLAGGEFPVPVPQVAASGVAPTVTVQFKEFGVRLAFVPFIEDGDVIRLVVDPEVSAIDNSLGTTLVAGGSPVPGLSTRKAHTTVEMRQGQTLMIAGLIQVQLDGQTSRIPGLGDLPILGPLFSNSTTERVEKELVVLVTPYLVEPLNHDQVTPLPGEEIKEPNDLELYLLGRLEGRTGREHRSTVNYDDPLHLLHHQVLLERNRLVGPCGFSD